MSDLTVFGGLNDILHYLDFDSKSWGFNRDILDNRPYKMVKGEKKTTIYLNCLGVSAEDISVTVEAEGRNNFLSIVGETHIEGLSQSYNVRAKFGINVDEIESIDYETKNGLLILTVNFKTIEKPKILINGKTTLAEGKKKSLK